MTTKYNKPLPRLVNEAVSRPFWDAAKRHELVMPRCLNCSNMFFYPREQCPNCYSDNTEWVPVSGKGRVYSYTVVYQPANRAFQEEAPYIFAIVQLNEGPRIPTNLLECEIDGVELEMPVEVVFDDVTDDVTLVKFKPA